METQDDVSWNARYKNGCEWCGVKIVAYPAAKGEIVSSYGLDLAHIFAKKHGPKHHWNSFVLCPTCHTLFDDVVKPRLLEAFSKGLGGFEDQGVNLCVANTYKDLLTKLIEPKAGQNLPALPAETTGVTTWLEDEEPRKIRYAKKPPNQAPATMPTAVTPDASTSVAPSANMSHL